MRTIEVIIKSVDEYKFHVELFDSVILYNKDDISHPTLKIKFRCKQFLFFKWIIGIEITINPYKFDKENQNE